MKNILKHLLYALSVSGCLAAGLGAIKLSQKENDMKFLEPKSEIDLQVIKTEREATLNDLEKAYIKSYNSIQDYQTKVSHGKQSLEDVQININFMLTELNLNSYKLLQILEQYMTDEIIESYNNGLTSERIKTLQSNGVENITYFEKKMLENIATKYEVYQFLEARNVLRGGSKNQINQTEARDNKYVQAIKGHSFIEDSKTLMRIAKQNFFELSTQEQGQDADAGEADIFIYFGDLRLHSQVFIMSGYITGTVGNIRLRECLALDILTQAQINECLKDLEKQGYPIDLVVSNAQDFVNQTLVEKKSVDKAAKKKTKFINQSVKLISQFKDAQGISR